MWSIKSTFWVRNQDSWKNSWGEWGAHDWWGEKTHWGASGGQKNKGHFNLSMAEQFGEKWNTYKEVLNLEFNMEVTVTIYIGGNLSTAIILKCYGLKWLLNLAECQLVNLPSNFRPIKTSRTFYRTATTELQPFCIQTSTLVLCSIVDSGWLLYLFPHLMLWENNKVKNGLGLSRE